MHEFVPLERSLALAVPRENARTMPFSRSPASPQTPVPPSVAAEEEPGADDALALRVVLSELMFARLAALEAFEVARERLLSRFADDVLARELALGPADLERLARKAVEEFAAFEPAVLEVAPGCAQLLDVNLPIRENRELLPGDLVIAVRDGTLDARFRVRVAAALKTLCS